MKLKFFFSFIFIAMSMFVMAQTKQQKAVAVAVEELRMAMISGNKSALESLVDDSLSYGHSNGNLDNKTTFIDKLTTGKSDFVTIELSQQTIYVSGKTAIVRHRLNATTNDNKKPGTVELDVMLVFEKQNSKWILLARQAVKVVH